jgi:hypothetical protein
LIDNTFYLPKTTACFLQLGPHYINQIYLHPTREIYDSSLYTITIDEMQQSLLYDSVTENDIGNLALLDIQSGYFPFTLARIIKINDTQIKIIPFLNANSLEDTWIESLRLKKWVPKSTCFHKNILLTKKNSLKKKIKKMLQEKYHI